jgi:hypothetical protein
MDQATIRVLLLSETEHGCANLRRGLEKRGCLCSFGSSFSEAAVLFRQHPFQLVISTIPFHQYDGLLARLAGLPSTVFQSFAVEAGSWWLPVARNGQPCIGAPALRPDEFQRAVNQIIEEISRVRALLSVISD